MKKITALLLTIVLVMVSFSGCGSSTETINVAAQTVNETVVLAHMAKLVIEDQTDYEVSINTDFSTSAILHEAMLKEEIDVYPTWIGTHLMGVLGYQGPSMSQMESYEYVKENFEKEFEMTWSEPVGFNNTYVFCVKEEVAEELGLEKCSDLAAYAADWKLAGDANFDTLPDAYPGWSAAYGIEFADCLPMTLSLVYPSIEADEVQVVAAYGTDPRIQEAGLVILEDDLSYFPDYSGSYVVREGALEGKEDVMSVLNSLSGVIDNETMSSLNGRYDNGEDPEELAREFLTGAGIIQ